MLFLVKKLHKSVFISFFILAVIVAGWGEEGKEAKQPLASAEQEIPEPMQRREPVFPNENTNIIFIEGEEAVSTNFNKEPTLNYSCSGQRTIQLNRTTGLQDGVAFYAHYLFYVNEPGEYELWYGGTPPGPQDDLYPSFSSPFDYILDNKAAVNIYREGINVVENYAPSYYWCLVNTVQLPAGQHNIRFEVKEKRRYDGKYYFYLDCFYLVKKRMGKRILGEPLPGFFPKDMENRGIDYPFKTIEDYLMAIRDNPDRLSAYLELSLIYTFIGDNLNAIKYLKRAALREPANAEVLLLLAKNYIWSGNVEEGLKLFRKLLLQNPQLLEIWSEAGKVAAWTGRYTESESFYLSGLENFPNDLNLIINLGLTNLWNGRAGEAELYFKKARSNAGKDYELLKQLAIVYEVNGYPERAMSHYLELIRLYPDHLELYLLLEKLYNKAGKKDDVQKLKQLIEKSFIPSPKLAQHIDLFRIREGFKEDFIKEYVNRLIKQPDNLELRSMLAQTYFWNGLREKGIEEYLHTIVNHTYKSMEMMNRNSLWLLDLLDKSYLHLVFLDTFLGECDKQKSILQAKMGVYAQAQKNYQAFLLKLEKSQEKGEVPTPAIEDLQATLELAHLELINTIAQTKAILTKFLTNKELYKQEANRLVELQSAEDKEQVVFNNMIKVNRWHWDRNEFFTELQTIASQGQVLADHVLGTVYQLEQNFPAAEKQFNKLKAVSTAKPDLLFGLIQTLLWSKKTTDAFTELETYKKDLAAFYPYLGGLKPYFDLLRSGVTQEKSDFNNLDEVLTSLVKAIDKAKEEGLSLQSEINGDQKSLHTILRQKMVRAIYSYQENTFLLRNELGDFYLKERKLEPAIRQFRQVLAIDPWDVSAIYKLGQVYEWSGNWKKAMQNFKSVYFHDPLYENVLRLYNNLAREHADLLTLETSSFAEKERFTFHTESTYTSPLNTVFGWGATYKGDYMRLYDIAEGQYQYHSLGIYVPLDLYFISLKLTPLAGMHFWNNQNNKTLSFNPGFNGVDFFGQVGFNLSFGEFVYANGKYYFGRQKETFAPNREKVYTHTGELSLTTKFSFIENIIAELSSVRLFGDIDVLTDDNLMYSAGTDCELGLFKIKVPYISLKAVGTGVFEDSLKETNSTTEYWAPQEVLLVGGGLAGYGYFNLGADWGMSLNLRGLIKSYQHHLFSAEKEKSIKIELEGTWELVKGEAIFYAGAQLVNTKTYSSPVQSNLGWGYWSFMLKFGYSARLPNFLTP